MTHHNEDHDSTTNADQSQTRLCECEQCAAGCECDTCDCMECNCENCRH